MSTGEARHRGGQRHRGLPNEDRLNALGRLVESRSNTMPSRSRTRPRRSNVQGNARLTSSLGAIIFVLLAIEGVTILRIHPLLSAHVFIGVLLIPPVLVKVATTSWRFIKYYVGDPEYRHKGPPALLLRLLGPVVVILTLIVIASGVALVMPWKSLRQEFFFIHRASFVLWFGAMTVHVLGHIAETLQLAPRDWLVRTRRQVTGASTRQWILVSSVILGVLTALAITPQAYGWIR